MTDVFISYRRDDSEGLAGRIFDQLNAAGRRSLFLNERIDYRSRKRSSVRRGLRSPQCLTTQRIRLQITVVQRSSAAALTNASLVGASAFPLQALPPQRDDVNQPTPPLYFRDHMRSAAWPVARGAVPKRDEVQQARASHLGRGA